MTLSKEEYTLERAAKERILVLDGAMGTMLQAEGLDEAQFRGDRFRNHAHPLLGNLDVLSLTRPGAVSKVHAAYLEAGADVIETNTFGATAISQVVYGLEGVVYELNFEGARLARVAADEWSERTRDKRRFVAGAMGPTAFAASAPRPSEPGERAIASEDLTAAFAEQIRGLVDGGVDVLLIETIVDAAAAEAALAAAGRVFAEKGRCLPIMLSVTLSNETGRLPSGHSLESFCDAVRTANPMSIGLNCSPDARAMRPYLEALSRAIPGLVSAHPSAGLPNRTGGYDQAPEEVGALLGDFAKAGLVDVVGGCCGTTPEHIRAIAEHVRGVEPRRPSARRGA